MAYKDRGYGTTIDNYKAQQEKKRQEQEKQRKAQQNQRKAQEKQKGPDSTRRLTLPKAGTASGRASSTYHTREKTVAPGTATVSRGNRVTGASVGNMTPTTGAAAPVSTERASAIPYNRAAQTFATPERKVSHDAFNRSTALRMVYHNYENYLADQPTTGGGYHYRPTIDAQKIENQNYIVNQYRQALEPAMEKLAASEDELKRVTEKAPAENWFTGTRPLREREKENAAKNYAKISNDAARLYKNYKYVEGVLDSTIAEEQRKEDEWKSHIRDPKSVQAEKDEVTAQIKAWQDELNGLKAKNYGGRLMSDILAPISPGAAADALSEAMNAQDRISSLEKMIAMGENQIPLLDDELYWANKQYYVSLANDLPVSVKRANAAKRNTRAYNIVDEPFTDAQKAASYLETFSPASKIANRAASLGFEKANLAQLTPEEREQYQKIVDNYDEETGAEYLKWLNSTELNTRRRVAEENAIRNYYRNASAVEQVAGYLDTVLLKPLSMGTYANQMIDYLVDGEIQKDASYNRASYLNTAVRSQITEDFGNFMASKFGEPWRERGQEAVQIGTSIMDNAYNMLLTAGIGNMAGLTWNAIESSSLLQKLKDVSDLTLYVMGTEAAADSTIEAMDRGLSSDQAIVLGTGAGLTEIFTEKVSLDSLLEGLGSADSFWEMVKSTGIQGITEGSEEGFGFWINKALDAWVSKDNSEWRQEITSYKLSHPHASDKDAIIAVFRNNLSQSLKEAESGAISGMLMSGGGFAIGAGKAYVQNRQNMTSPENINALVESAKDIGKDTDGYKAVQELQAKLESGQKITPHEVALAQRDVDIAHRTNSEYVQKQIEEAKKYEGTDAAKKAAAIEKRISSGAEITYDNVVDLEQATARAKATSYDTLKPIVAAGLVSDQGSKAFKAAESLQHKMDEGKEITLREANAARKAVREAVAADFTSANPELIGRRLITESGRQALTDAATDLKQSTMAADVRRGEQALQMIKDGTVDAKTAGEVFLRSQQLIENTIKQQQNPRVLQPREVTEDMDAYDRSAAELGISVEEASRNKAIMQAFNIKGRYEAFENNSLNAYYDRATGEMVLNANADNPGLALIAHEVTHSLEKTAGYRQLADLIFRQSKDLGADLDRITREYKDSGIDLDKDGNPDRPDAKSELVAEFVEQHMFNDEKFINDVVSTDRTLARKVLDAIDNLLAKLGNKNAQERKLLRDARALWAEALRQRDRSNAARAKIEAKKSEAKKLTLPAVEQKAAAVRKTEGPKGLGLKQVNEGIQAGIKQATLTAGIGIGQNASGKFVFNINGKNVTKVTADHIKNHSAFGALISIARDGIGGREGTISPEQAEKQYQSIADLMNLVMTTQNPQMTWEFAGSMLFSAVKSNSDGQYGTTVDFSTVCLKTVNIINALSERMMVLGRGLNRAEVTQLQKELADEGLVVPCPVCYVFSRWAGAGSLLDNMNKFQQKYDGKTDAEIETAIERLKARDEKAIQEGIRRRLREGKSQENQDAYTQLMGDVEKADYNISQLKEQVKTAKKNGRSADVEALEDAINANREWKKKSQKQMEKIERDLDVAAQELAWLEQVRTKPGYQPVPTNILFNMASADAIEEFMTNPHYAMSYRYRTTRGSAMGKAIEPYADMRLGDFIQPEGKKSADGNTLFASPLDVDGEFNDEQKDAIIEAIARVRAQNLIGGQRFQSTSDFRYEYALDYIQAFFEAQALGSNMQTYTKVIEFGEMVARIGGDVNLSVMPKNKGFKIDETTTPQNPKGDSDLSYEDGDYTGGYLIYSNKTGIDFGAAKILKDSYGNAQMILVGINDDHIRLALNDQFDEFNGKKVSYTGGYHVGFVIPYHTSGAAIDTFIRDLVSNLGETFLRENYQDYTDVGSDKVKSTSTKAQDRRRKLRRQLLTGKDGAKNWKPSDADVSWIREYARRQKSMYKIRSMSFEEMHRIEQQALHGDPAAIREYESWSAGMLFDLYKKMWRPKGAEYGVRLNSEQSKTIMPHEFWDTNGTRDKAYVNNFLFRSYCYNLGMTPRFTGINASGKVTDHGDFSDCKGYWKTLIDRSMYDLDGKYRPQQAINMSELEVGMVHPSWSEENWSEYSAKQPEVERAKEIGRAVKNLPNQKQFAIAKPVERSGNLIAVHNLTVDQASKILRLGGFPAPSIAVVKKAMGHNQYGPVSALFYANAIDPEADSRNKIYGADAWTPTTGNVGIDYKIDGKKLLALENELWDLSKKTGSIDGRDGPFTSSSVVRSIIGGHGDVSTYSADEIAERLSYTDYAMAAYLGEAGIPVKPARRQRHYTSIIGNETLAAVADALGTESMDRAGYDLKALSDDELTKLKQIVSEDAHVKKLLSVNRGFNILSEDRLERIIRAANRYAEDAANDNTEDYDYDEIRDQMRSYVNPKDVRDWIKKKLDGIVSEDPAIYNGEDYYSEDGRKTYEETHVPYTAQNMVDAMYENESDRASGGGGVTRLIAAVTKEFKSLDEVRSNEKLLRADPLYDGYIVGIKRLVDGIESHIDDMTRRTMFPDDVIEFIINHQDAANIERLLAETFDIDTNLYADDLEYVADLIEDTIHDIRNLPTKYFEAKPGRAMGFDEVAGWVIPQGTETTLGKAIRKNGMSFKVYQEGNNDQRRDALNAFKNVSFAISKAQDTAYLKAVESGDMETAQRMVDEAASNYIQQFLLPNDDDEVGFKYHRGPAPTKTFKRYAAMNVKPDGFRAAYAGNENATPVGVWLDAQNLQSYTSDLVQFDDGTFATYIPGDTGAATNTKFSKEAQGRLQLRGGQRWLLERGGKHSSDVPNFSQMNLHQNERGEKVKSAKEGALPHNKLVFEIEYGISDNGDLTDYVRENGRMMKGKNQGLQHIQPNQYYDFKTNPNAVGNWGIGGTFRVLRLVPHSEIVSATNQYKTDAINEANRLYEAGEISKKDRDARIRNANAIQIQKWVDGYHPEDFGLSEKLVADMAKQGSKMKLTDAVTYDDNGDVIPLSERFNPGKKDLRYAINKDATIRTEGDLIDSVINPEDSREEWDEIIRDIRMYAGDTAAGRTLFEMAKTYGISAVEQYIRTQGSEGTTVQAIRKYFAPADQMIDDAISPKAARVQGIENALDDFFEEVRRPGADRITTKVNAKPNGTLKDRSIASALFLYRKMVDSGEAVSRLGKYSNDPHLYPCYNMARASTNAAVSMIQNAQTDTMGRKVGDSLNEIFDRIRAKGDDYYADLQLYLYHMLNIERMSRENPMAVVEAREELARFRRDNPEFNGMKDDEILKLAYDPISMYHEQAQLYADISKKYDKARSMRNKPVFGMETVQNGVRRTVPIDSKTSQRVAKELREELSKIDGFEDDVKAIYKYIDNLTRYRIDSGLITEEDYNTLRKAYPHYVPASAMMQVEEAPTGSEEKSTEVGKTIKRARGNTKYVLQPLHKVLAQQTLSVVREGSKNRFGQMLLDRQGQSRGMIRNVEKLEGDFNEDAFDQEEKSKDNTFVVRQDGKRYEIRLDNAMYEAIDALSPTPEDDNIFMKALHKATEIFKALNTSLNPVFMIKNPIRDVQDAGLFSKDLSEFVKQYPKAAKEIAKNGKYWQLYQSLGGLYSSVFDFMTGEMKRSGKLKAITIDKFEALQMGIEQAPRLAEFMATVKKAEAKGEVTMDDLMEAIYNAAEVTVNFGRSGKWGKALNRSVVPFLNPGIQGMDKIIRTVANTEGANEWARLVGKCALLGIVPAILNRILWGKRKDYEEMTQSNRDLYYLFPLRYGVWLRVPKGRALSVLGMTTDRIIQMFDGKDADWGSFIKTAWNQIAPEATAYWQPFRDARLLDNDNPGKTWYGGDIENRRMQSLAPGERYDTSTDKISKWIGKTFGLSPKKVNYLLDQYSGVLGDIFLPVMSQKAHKDIFSAAFTVDTDFTNRLSNDFYNILDKSEYAKNSPEATPEETTAYKYLYNKSQAINKVNAAIREIEQDDSLSNKEKEELTRAQYMLRNEIMRDAISQVKAYQNGDTDNDIYKGAEEERAQKARESKKYEFKGQEMSWDDLSGRQKRIVMAQEAVTKDKNADLTDILGNKAPSQGAMYSSAKDAGISNQKYLDALTAVDNANNGDSNYTNAETQAGLDQAIADGKITAADANKLWPIISGGSPKNNPYTSGKLELPSVDTGASSQASSYENQTYTFNGEEKSYSDLSGTQKKIVQSRDALKNDPDADLSDIIGKGNATKKLAQYQAARDKGISNQTYIDALQAIDDADDGNGTYNQKEAKAGLEQLVSDGKISEKDAGIIWKVITDGADKNNPFPVGAIISRPMGLRLPKIG